MFDIITGYVEKIVYRNESNGYTVISLSLDNDEIVCVGNFISIDEGEYIEVSGTYTKHYTYGEQFIVKEYKTKEPDDIIAIERYLSSGAIKGIGPKLASRIVKKFNTNTFKVIENEPEKLSTIKGISNKMAMSIYKQFDEKRSIRTAMMFLQKYGITGNIAIKIYEEYEEDLYNIIENNPYKLAEDISGIGFITADEIGNKVGIDKNSSARIEAGILYTLSQAGGEGHVFLPYDNLVFHTKKILNVSEETIHRAIESLSINKKIVISDKTDKKEVYLKYYYYMELNIARMLMNLSIDYNNNIDKDFEETIDNIEKKQNIELDKLQKNAVIEANKNGLLIITGGPGTGKTTTINAIIKSFEQEDLEILLAAPTGRAAKKMSETTGYEAKTIHRLLELSKMTSDIEREHKYIFERNETNPLETDVIIIDEMSMVDINLMNSLLKAIPVGTRLILVGDVNQLPSVGPGNVLRDIIDSQKFNVVKLNKIFRQAAESDIIINAHKINNGEHFNIDNKSKDFFLFRRKEADDVIGLMIYLIKEKLPPYVNVSPYEIQVLTPMRKGDLGVERLNKILQKLLNPPSKNKKEKERYNNLYREGDKVMQIKNNYQLEWQMIKNNVPVQNGMGVFNGDCGVIKQINLLAEIICVEFDDNRIVEYSFSKLDELELAYAITIHKSQGSEYPAVVLPLLSGPKLLFNRNLLYTAVTRAKSCVTIVGSNEIVESMINNKNEQMRFSNLNERIKSI